MAFVAKSAGRVGVIFVVPVADFRNHRLVPSLPGEVRIMTTDRCPALQALAMSAPGATGYGPPRGFCRGSGRVWLQAPVAPCSCRAVTHRWWRNPRPLRDNC